MGTYQKINNFFNSYLIEKASLLNYSQTNILILKGDFDAVRTSDPVQYKNIISCVHNADNRTAMQYAQDIVASWVFEDYILDALQNDDFKIKLDGGDKQRKFLKSTKVSADSDYELSYKNRTFKLELMTNFTDYWSKYKRVDLRDSKYLKLKNEKSIFLGISLLSNEFFAIDFSNAPSAKFLPYYKAYGKPAYQMALGKEVKLYPLTSDSLQRELLRVIQNHLMPSA